VALVLIDGFEDVSSWTSVSGDIQAGRNGNAFRSFGSNNRFPIPAALESDTVTFGFAFKPSGMSGLSVCWVLASDANATDHLYFLVNADGSITAQRAPGVTLGTTATGLITATAFAYIEVQAKLHDTTGTLTIRVNGTDRLNLTGQDTKNAGTKTTFDTLRIGTGNVALYDDLYLMAGTGDTFLGDIKVETLYPNGDGNANQWLGSDGNSVSNYLLVNEVGAPVTTSYVGDAVSGHQDLYQLTNLVSTTGAILGVCHQVTAAASDAGAKSFKIVNRRAADTKSAALTLTSTFGPFHYPLATDPETGAAWTIANVNALQSGVEVV